MRLAGIGVHFLTVGYAVSNNVQLLIQKLGRNRHGGARLLRQQRNSRPFNYAMKSFDLVLRELFSERLMLAGVNLALDLSRSGDQFPIRSVGA